MFADKTFGCPVFFPLLRRRRQVTRGNSQVASTTPATQPKPAVTTAAA
jgi:hypothetical protein